MSCTSPADLRLILVDLKNEDLLPFAGLPHVEMLATSLNEAESAILRVFEEKEQRVRAGRGKFQRWVLVIDELAEFARQREAMKLLSSVLAVGRSKAINVMAATQKPTAAIVGSVAKANFTLRLVGRVLSADDARVAAGQSGSGAEWLPGKGAFLKIDGADTRRFQAYFIDDADAWIEPVSDLWYQQLSFVLPEMTPAQV